MGFKCDRKGFIIKSGLFLGSVVLMPQSVFSNFFLSDYERVLLGINEPEDLIKSNYVLRKEAGESFEQMCLKAKEVGIEIYSQSSYRSYNRQLAIWERKYEKYKSQGYSGKNILKKIIEYSTIPGTSRHHWGTDLDVIDKSQSMPSDPLLEKHYINGGVYAKMYDWLLENANSFGFYQVYTKSSQRKGFEFEPWHWSYKSLAIPMLKDYLDIDLKKFFNEMTISGKDNLSNDFIREYKESYILGIDSELFP